MHLPKGLYVITYQITSNMISVKRARKILGKEGEHLTDEDIKLFIKDLTEIGYIAIEVVDKIRREEKEKKAKNKNKIEKQDYG